MIYNGINSTRGGLVEDTLYNCGLPTVTASYSSYALADITRNLNNAYLEVTPKIWAASYLWRYDDSNKTNLPIAYTTITNGQQDYSLPSDAQTIREVRIKQGSNYVPLTQVNVDDFNGGSGSPTGYCPLGRSILLDPTPSSTILSGLAVYVDREPTLFTTASTTEEPGFASSFHKILSYSAAIDFVQDKATQDRLVAMKARLENQMIAFYSKRNIERKANIRPAKNINRYK
jgi:hypothetical protein